MRVAVGRSDVAPARGDRRFTDAAWQQNPVFRRLMQAYLVENDAAHRVIDEVELDTKSRARAHFAMSLLTEALAPTNFLLTNPDAMAKAVQTRGQSLVAGARNVGARPASQRRHAVAGRHQALRPSAATSGSRPGRSCTAPRCSS